MQKRKKNTFTQAKVLRENEIVIVRLPNKSCDLICLKINNPRWASNAVSGVSLQVQHLQEAINLALASEIAPLAPLAPLLHNPDRSRSARRREVSPWSRHVWFVLEGEGGGISHIIALCIFTRNLRMLEELHGVMSQVQAGLGVSSKLERIFTFSRERTRAFS